MKKTKSKKLTSVFMIFGIILIVLSVTAVLVSEISKNNSIKNTEVIVSELRSLMPETVDCVPDDRINTVMPILQVKKDDFVGIIEVPLFGTELPLCDEWNGTRVSQYPCRYMGSTYDNSLIIGGSDNKGQFDFIKKISNGDIVSVTDATGQRFSYTVTDIRKTKDVSTENLTSKDCDLVLFARNSFAFDYTVVRCDLK